VQSAKYFPEGMEVYPSIPQLLHSFSSAILSHRMTENGASSTRTPSPSSQLVTIPGSVAYTYQPHLASILNFERETRWFL
jgi:hypothetical protein